MKRTASFFISFLSICSIVIQWSCSNDEPELMISDVDIYINEVFPSGAPDWLELYNPNDVSIDLSGFFIYDDPLDKYSLPAGTSISAGGYLILNCDGLATGLSTNFRLSVAGETVSLESAESALVDQFTYPALPDGASYGRFDDGTNNLQISGLPSKGTSNGGSGAVAVQSVSQSPSVVTATDEVLVTAEITSNNSITTIEIQYLVDNIAQSALTMTNTSGGIYTATLPALSNGGQVDYSVRVVDSADNEVILSGFNYLVNNDVLPSLFINEFMASNDACCPDNDSGLEEFDDWIEIYNPGTTAVDLAGYYLSDDPLKPLLYKVPDTDAVKTTIAPGGFLLFWADKDLEQGANHLEFKLSSLGETVGLYYIDGRKIDEYTFGAQTKNVSEGRQTDGAGTWVKFTTPTPGNSN